MRIFKTKTLAKFTRQHGISDDGLVDAVERAVRGLIDADLGGQIIKQRVARPGQGKRGGFRMIIGLRADRAIFLFAFRDNERGRWGFQRGPRARWEIWPIAHAPWRFVFDRL